MKRQRSSTHRHAKSESPSKRRINVLGPLALVVATLLGPLQDPAIAGPEAPALALPTENSERIEQEADQILRQMGAFLASANEFSFRIDVNYDRVKNTGQKILFGGKSTVLLQRPNRLHTLYQGDNRHDEAIWADGMFTYYDMVTNLYAQMAVPDNLDAALDAAFDLAGFDTPVADFLYSNPYDVLINSARSGFVAGSHPVDDINCHHLVFTHDAIDWQVWIEDGPRPVPRKLVITYKNERAAPQFVVKFKDWNFDPKLSKRDFEFHPPAEASEMAFLPRQEEVTQ